MEKDIGRIKKNPDTDIVIRIDEFGGKPGLTIREFVNRSDSGFKGFTKSGTRIPLESFTEFQRMISLIKPEDFGKTETQQKIPEESEEDSGIDEEGFM